MLTTQAKIVMFVQIIQIITILVAVQISKLNTREKALSSIAIFVFMGLGAALSVLAVNCMIIGNCDLLAWIVVGVLLLNFVFAIISSSIQVAYIQKPKQE